MVGNATLVDGTFFNVNESKYQFTPNAEKLFHPEIYGGETMLSLDKITACEGLENATTITERPGATIVSPILLSLAGIAGQIAALIYLHRSTRPTHHRTVFYVMLATLIWTDLIGKVITTPPAILSYAHGHWVGGMKMCNLHGFSMITVGLVTHFLVSAMAVDRFLCVRHGYFYRTNVTRSQARVMLMGIWLFCIIFCALPLFGVGEFEAQYPGTWCFVNIHVGPHTPWYIRGYTNVYGALNVLNLFIIVFCNLIVIGTLITTRFSRNQKFSASNCATQRSSYQRELEIQMVIVLTVITMVFLSSWSPLDLRLFLNQIWPHRCREEHIADLISVRMASLNQIVDPWAYIICRRVFTSRIWKNCRSLLIGRGFSSKKDELRKWHVHDSRRMGAPTTSIDGHNHICDRRHSIPTTELCKITCIKETDKDFLRANNRTSPKSSDDVFRDSGTASAKDASFSSDEFGNSSTVQMYPQPIDERPVKKYRLFSDDSKACLPVPIPVFVREQYRLSGNFHRRGKRLFSTHSAKSEPHHKLKESVAESDKVFSRKLSGRSHSWCCSPSQYKQFRTQSTQTSDGT